MAIITVPTTKVYEEQYGSYTYHIDIYHRTKNIQSMISVPIDEYYDTEHYHISNIDATMEANDNFIKPKNIVIQGRNIIVETDYSNYFQGADYITTHISFDVLRYIVTDTGDEPLEIY